MIEATKPHKIDEMIKTLENKIPTDYAPQVQENLKTKTPEEMFKDLVKKIKEKDIDLGVCFETSIRFISFENNTIKWESCPDENCKKMFLRFFSPVIRPLLNEIFGIGVSVDVIRCEKKNETREVKEPKPLLQNDQEEDLIRKVREIFGTDVKIEKIIVK
jgi:DNA polymerase-3 subunit gamma/tau